MEAQRRGADGVAKAPPGQIDRRQGASDGLTRPEQSAGGFGRVPGCRVRLRVAWRRLGLGQVEKGPGLLQGLAQGKMASVEPDQVEEVAMLTSPGVGPFSRRALARGGTVQADEEAAAAAVHDIA